MGTREIQKTHTFIFFMDSAIPKMETKVGYMLFHVGFWMEE